MFETLRRIGRELQDDEECGKVSAVLAESERSDLLDMLSLRVGNQARNLPEFTKLSPNDQVRLHTTFSKDRIIFNCFMKMCCCFDRTMTLKACLLRWNLGSMLNLRLATLSWGTERIPGTTSTSGRVHDDRISEFSWSLFVESKKAAVGPGFRGEGGVNHRMSSRETVDRVRGKCSAQGK